MADQPFARNGKEVIVNVVRKRLLSVPAAVLCLLVFCSVAYAWTGYHGSWPARPTYGEWSWRNNTPNSNYVTWTTFHQWNTLAAGSIAADWLLGTVYHLEYEAFDPGTPAYCNNFEAEWFTTGNLPAYGYPSWSSQCGDGTNNEVRVWIAGDQVASSTAYYTTLELRKRESISGTSGAGICDGKWRAEVNLSFAALASDDWLGKVYYLTDTYAGTQKYDKCGDDPAGIVY